MRSNKHSKLENIILQPKARKHHRVHSDHPHETLANYVMLMAFISLMLLGAIFLWMTSEQMPSTAFVVADFSNATSKIGDSLSGITDTLGNVEYRSQLMMISYICWILIVGAANLYYVERQYSVKKK